MSLPCIDLTAQSKSKRSSPGMTSPEEAVPLGESETEQELYRQRILNKNPPPPAATFSNLNVNGPMIDTNLDSCSSTAELASPSKKAKINDPEDIVFRDAQDPDSPGFSENTREEANADDDESTFTGGCVSPTQPFVNGEGLEVDTDDGLLPEDDGPPAPHSPLAVPDGGVTTPIDLLTFQNSLTMMFKTLSDQMQNNNQQLMNEMGSFKSDVKTKLKQNALQIKKTAAEQQTSIDSMDKRISTGLELQNRVIANLTRPLAALEERDPISSAPRQAAALAATSYASVAAAAVDAPAAPDPWHAFNLEKELGRREKNYKHPLKQQDSSFSSASNTKGAFTPRFVHIQVWATFNDDTAGITQDAAKILAEKIKILLPIDCRPLVTEVSAGRLLNSRISLRIRDGGEQCWIVKRRIDEALAATPLTIRGHRVPSPGITSTWLCSWCLRDGGIATCCSAEEPHPRGRHSGPDDEHRRAASSSSQEGLPRRHPVLHRRPGGDQPQLHPDRQAEARQLAEVDEGRLEFYLPD